MRDKLVFQFCEVEIYNRYMVVTVNEGIHLEPVHNDVLVNLVDTYFKGVEFAYITNRKHSYSVNPSIYLKTSKIENLKGFAIVSRNYNAKSNAEIEKLFLSKPLEIFSDLEDAIEWAEKIIKSESVDK